MDKKSYIILGILLFGVFSSLSAQVPVLGGMKLNKDKYLKTDYKESSRSSPPGGSKSLRDSFDMQVFYQGAIASCTGYAIAATVSIRRKFYFNQVCRFEKESEQFSASYIFNQVKQTHCDSGAYIIDALDTLLAQGICFEEEFANDPYFCDEIPSETVKAKAASNKIWQYKRVYKLEEECSDDPFYLDNFKDEFVQKTISEIDNGNPVIVGIKVSSDFAKCKNSIWKVSDQSNLTYGHAMVAIGYDDVNKELEFLNSFGPTWGDKGFIKIKYDDFKKVALCGFVIYLDKNYLNCSDK